MTQLVPMTIKGLMLDPVSNSPIVVLKDEDDKFFLPIWVGIFEANAIALQLESVATPRPMTHDLLREAISQLEARVTRVVINDLRRPSSSPSLSSSRLRPSRPKVTTKKRTTS
jgi:bifunctional DNase/RNase